MAGLTQAPETLGIRFHKGAAVHSRPEAADHG